jgi:hypothetical protein
MLKELVQSGAQLRVSELAPDRSFEAVEIKRLPGEREPIRLPVLTTLVTPPQSASGVTLPSQGLAASTFGGSTSKHLSIVRDPQGKARSFYSGGVVSPSKDVLLIYLQEDLVTDTTGGVLAHELFGHFYIAVKGAPGNHPDPKISPFPHPDSQISPDAGIALPDGGTFQGSVDEWMELVAPSRSKEWIDKILNPQTDGGTGGSPQTPADSPIPDKGPADPDIGRNAPPWRVPPP